MAETPARPPEAVLRALCAQKKSHRDMARMLHVAPSTIGLWLHAYGLKTVNGPNTRSTRKPLCVKCHTADPACFTYGRKKMCNKCWDQQRYTRSGPVRADRRTTLKYAAVQAKGGCCQKCGYRKNLAALQFHHPDRNLKHENWSTLFLNVSSSPKKISVLAAELEKCELLCANCHAENHHPKTMMPMCVTGKQLTYLSKWVEYLRHFFHGDANGAC